MEGSVLDNVTASEMHFLCKRIKSVNITYASPQLITMCTSATLNDSIH
jgi:hypothetical protein